jgi:hypothetical protein
MHPVYAPALVGWIGAPGSGVSIDIGSSAPVIWFPLAPREVFAPFYRASPAHVRSINAPHVAHLANADRIVARPREFARDQSFAHRRDPNALNTASMEAFRRPRPGTRAAQHAGKPPEARIPRPSADPRAPGPRRAESAGVPPPSRSRQAPQEFRRMEVPQPRPGTVSTPIRRDRPPAAASQPAASPRTAPPQRTFSSDSSSRRVEAPRPRSEPDTASRPTRRERPQATVSQPAAGPRTAPPQRIFSPDSGSRRANATPQAPSSPPARPSGPVMERPQPRSAPQRSERRNSDRQRGR